MLGSRSRTQWLLVLWAIVLVLLSGSLGACGGPPVYSEEETSVARLTEHSPEMVLTLTAWPSPPPLVTRSPTPTVAPQALWTASPEPDTAPTTTPSPEATASSSETAPSQAMPPGSQEPPVRLLIPKLNLDAPVVQVSWDVVLADGTWQSVWQTADGAAGHHRNSVNPGEAGNVVVSGHHNTRGEVFRQVSEIGQPGSDFGIGDDIILITQDGQRFTYTVVDWARFQEEGASIQEQREHASYLAPTTDARLTLVTCWPYESNTHRVVVVAKLKP